jgi:hypothetical protein
MDDGYPTLSFSTAPDMDWQAMAWSCRVQAAMANLIPGIMQDSEKNIRCGSWAIRRATEHVDGPLAFEIVDGHGQPQALAWIRFSSPQPGKWPVDIRHEGFSIQPLTREATVLAESYPDLETMSDNISFLFGLESSSSLEQMLKGGYDRLEEPSAA